LLRREPPAPVFGERGDDCPHQALGRCARVEGKDIAARILVVAAVDSVIDHVMVRGPPAEAERQAGLWMKEDFHITSVCL
jgi:hypothetical protein